MTPATPTTPAQQTMQRNLHRRRQAREQALLRHLGVNLAIGLAFGVALASLILFSNVAQLRELIIGSPDAAIALALLYGGFAVTFGSVAMGTGVFLLPREADDDYRHTGTRTRAHTGGGARRRNYFGGFGIGQQRQPALAPVRIAHRR